MTDSWIHDQIRSAVLTTKNGKFGVLSTGEKLAAALVLNRADLLAAERYTIVEAISRVGESWMAHLPGVERELRDEGVI